MTVTRISYYTCDVCKVKEEHQGPRHPSGWIRAIRKGKSRHICPECLNEIDQQKAVEANASLPANTETTI